MARSTNMIVPEILEQETLRASAEQLAVFNAASGGCIVLTNDVASQRLDGGDYTKTVRIKRPSDLVTHIDSANPANAASNVSITQGSGLTVRWQGKIGPAKFTDDEVLSGAKSTEQYNMALAALFASEQTLKIRNLITSIGVAAIDSADTTDGSTASANIHIYDVSRGKTAGAKVTCTAAYLNRLLAKMADARNRITLFVMPSTVFADLVGDSISNYKIESVAGMTLYRDVVQAFGRNILVYDAASLTSAQTSSYYTNYYVLGLGQNALRATLTHQGPVETDRVLTTEVKYTLLRQDFTVDFAVEGMKWSPSSATPNPTDAQIATAANWDEDYEDHRDCPIVKGVFNGT